MQSKRLTSFGGNLVSLTLTLTAYEAEMIRSVLVTADHRKAAGWVLSQRIYANVAPNDVMEVSQKLYVKLGGIR